MEQDPRKIKFENTSELPPTTKRFSATREAKPDSERGGEADQGGGKGLKRNKKVESNPRLVLAILALTVGATLVIWWTRRIPEAIRELSSPRIVEIMGDSKESKSKIAEERRIDWEKLKMEVGSQLKAAKGDYSVDVYDLASRKSIGIGENRPMTAASLIKLPVLISLYQQGEFGKINPDSKYVLEEADKRQGSGSMAYAKAGSSYTYRKMAELMGQQSDNTAFHVVTGRLGGEAIEKTITQAGLLNTSFKENETTAYDVATLLIKLYRGELLNRKNSDEILGFLTKTIYEDRIPTGVPTGVRVAHKVGTEVGVVSDGGIVYAKNPYVLVIMSKEASLAEAQKLLPEVSRVVWNYLGDIPK